MNDEFETKMHNSMQQFLKKDLCSGVRNRDFFEDFVEFEKKTWIQNKILFRNRVTFEILKMFLFFLVYNIYIQVILYLSNTALHIVFGGSNHNFSARNAINYSQRYYHCFSVMHVKLSSRISGLVNIFFFSIVYIFIEYIYVQHVFGKQKIKL